MGELSSRVHPLPVRAASIKEPIDPAGGAFTGTCARQSGRAHGRRLGRLLRYCGVTGSRLESAAALPTTGRGNRCAGFRRYARRAPRTARPSAECWDARQAPGQSGTLAHAVRQFSRISGFDTVQIDQVDGGDRPSAHLSQRQAESLRDRVAHFRARSARGTGLSCCRFPTHIRAGDAAHRYAGGQ